MDNLGLNIEAAQTAVINKDLSSYENYTSGELLDAVVDNYWLEVTILKQAKQAKHFLIVIPFLNDNGLWDVLENGTVYRIAAETFEQAAQYMIDDLLTDNLVIL